MLSFLPKFYETFAFDMFKSTIFDAKLEKGYFITMKKLIVAIVLLLAVGLRSYADSPLTSTDFCQAYKTKRIIKHILTGKGNDSEQQHVDVEVWQYLANPKNPIDVKMACINLIGWDIDGTHHADSWYAFLNAKGDYRSMKTFVEKAPADQLLCMAYLKALDNYFSVSEAAAMARAARDKRPESYTFNMVCALIEAQEEFNKEDGDWCRVGDLTDALRQNEEQFDNDMNDEAKNIIFEYMDLYLCSEEFIDGEDNPYWITDQVTWFDGTAFYFGTLEEDYVNFGGGTLHEGGYGFGLIPTEKEDEFVLRDGFFMSDTLGGEGVISIRGTAGDKVVVKTFDDGGSYMIVYDKNGHVTDVLSAIDSPSIAMEDDIVNFYLAGSYKSETKGTLVFRPFDRTVEGLLKTPQAYTIETLFGSIPTNVITVRSTGKSYGIEKDDNGDIEVFNCRYDEDQDVWVKGGLHGRFERVRRVGDSVYDLVGEYPEVSSMVLNIGQLSLFSKKELRLMHNEVFARYGMIFKSPDLKAYFEAQPWYKPVFDDVNDKLTEIERINLDLIRNVEKSEYYIFDRAQ